MNTRNRKAPIFVRVAIVEDNPFVREAWLSALTKAEDIEVVGAFGSCEEAFSSSAFDDADVLLMDIGLPGMSGIDGAQRIHDHHPEIAIVMCTVYEDAQKIFDALCAGAVGYLMKEIEPYELIKAITDAANGDSPMTPNIARKVIAAFQKQSSKDPSTDGLLTNREREVLVLLAEGKSYAVIAHQLYLSIDGVVSRIRKVYEKLQVHSRAEAVATGLAQGIIPPPSKRP